MTGLAEAELTVAEAAFVAGVSAETINREIDAKIIPAKGTERKVRGADLFYLAVIRDVRNHLGPSLRKSFRRAICEAAVGGEREAHYRHFVFSMTALREELLTGFSRLERTVGQHVEQNPGVLSGEPVLKGTRLAVRHIADLLRQGATIQEIKEDYDLSDSQVEAARIYDVTHPKRGRPIRRRRTTHVPAAR